MSKSSLFDLRQGLFRDAFAIAESYDRYLLTGTSLEQEKFKKYKSLLQPTEAERKTAASWRRELNILVFSGMWCGDCARQCPMLESISDLSKHVTVRFLDNRTHSNFSDEVRVHGTSRVPTAVFLSEDFFELARFGDKTYAYYRKKRQQSEGASCDAGLGITPKEELQDEFSEWFRITDRLQCLLEQSPMLRERHGD